MKVILKGEIHYTLSEWDIDFVDEVDFDDALKEINSQLQETMQDTIYLNEIKEVVNEKYGNVLNEILNVSVDEDSAFMELDVVDRLTDKQIIKIFKPELEDFLYQSDIEGKVRCSINLDEEDRLQWNILTGDYEYVEVNSYDDYLRYTKTPLTNCKVIRKESN